MNEAVKIKSELETARKKIASLEKEIENQKKEFSKVNLEIEKNRGTLLRLLEDLENANSKIRIAHQEWIDALDRMQDPIFLHDKEYRILRCNRAYQKCTGKKFKEIIGKPYFEIFPKLENYECCGMGDHKKDRLPEDEIINEGDQYYRLRFFPVEENGEYLYSVHILENITEKKHSEDMFRMLINTAVVNTGEGFFSEIVSGLSRWLEADCVIFGELVDENKVRARSMLMDGKFIDNYEYNLSGTPCNNVAKKGYCYYGDNVAELFPEDIDLKKMGALSYAGIAIHDSKDKHVNSIICVIFRRKISEPSLLKGVLEIISARASAEIERSRAEKTIIHLNQTLSALSTVNRNLVREEDEEKLLNSICETIIKHRDYHLALVGYVQKDHDQSIKIMASAGEKKEFIKSIKLSWGENEFGQGPSGRAVRLGKTQVLENVLADRNYLPWKAAALKYSIISQIVLPLKNRDGEVFGILNVYSNEENAFVPGEIKILEEMAEDLAFGVRSLGIRKERDRALEENKQRISEIEESLEDTVRAMASIVELRDPYTAGHQERTTELAVEISKKMKLPAETVQAVQIAGSLHDLGKIQVPAEILSKPGKISELDYSFIKTHCQSGYDILKTIKFPWPVADIVLQHHEKLDGSGYPNGLEGEEIKIEARILCVADVIEAMSSHRPYRASLGIDAALAEIKQNSGTLFDNEVVEAAIELFQKDNFQFSS